MSASSNNADQSHNKTVVGNTSPSRDELSSLSNTAAASGPAVDAPLPPNRKNQLSSRRKSKDYVNSLAQMYDAENKEVRTEEEEALLTSFRLTLIKDMQEAELEKSRAPQPAEQKRESQSSGRNLHSRQERLDDGEAVDEDEDEEENEDDEEDKDDEDEDDEEDEDEDEEDIEDEDAGSEYADSLDSDDDDKDDEDGAGNLQRGGVYHDETNESNNERSQSDSEQGSQQSTAPYTQGQRSPSLGMQFPPSSRLQAVLASSPSASTNLIDVGERPTKKVAAESKGKNPLVKFGMISMPYPPPSFPHNAPPPNNAPPSNNAPPPNNSSPTMAAGDNLDFLSTYDVIGDPSRASAQQSGPRDPAGPAPNEGTGPRIRAYNSPYAAAASGSGSGSGLGASTQATTVQQGPAIPPSQTMLRGLQSPPAPSSYTSPYGRGSPVAPAAFTAPRASYTSPYTGPPNAPPAFSAHVAFPASSFSAPASPYVSPYGGPIATSSTFALPAVPVAVAGPSNSTATAASSQAGPSTTRSSKPYSHEKKRCDTCGRDSSLGWRSQRSAIADMCQFCGLRRKLR